MNFWKFRRPFYDYFIIKSVIYRLGSYSWSNVKIKIKAYDLSLTLVPWFKIFQTCCDNDCRTPSNVYMKISQIKIDSQALFDSVWVYLVTNNHKNTFSDRFVLDSRFLINFLTPWIWFCFWIDRYFHSFYDSGWHLWYVFIMGCWFQCADPHQSHCSYRDICRVYSSHNKFRFRKYKLIKSL